MKKSFAIIISVCIIAMHIPFIAATAEEIKMIENSFTISGFDKMTETSGIIVYPAGDTDRVIGAADYNFRYSSLLIFNADGRLIEAGGDLLANADGTFGSPQLTVTVPAGGFCVAYGGGAPAALKKCKEVAMEGAMLYNATMSIRYEMYGSYSGNTLTIKYPEKEILSEDALTFLFVGNSTTYFNGTPIKFKALAIAAGVDVQVEYCTFGSAFLSEFADETHERGKALRSKLNVKKYDYVVLQDAASADATSMKSSLAVILPLIEKNGATPLLYMRYGTSLEGTAKHYANYTAMSELYGIENAPLALAYQLCFDKYPEVNLLADDLGHHSKEGSYLIACTWLYTYLGIDPTGNSYLADMDKATCEKLWECAVKACEEGYDFPASKNDNTVEIDGKEYKNLALNKSYTSSGQVYSDEKWTDTGSDGNPIGKLTDGIFATSGSDLAIGAYKGSNIGITIDLGEIGTVKRFVTDLYGNSSWGIGDPKSATVEVLYSTDGTSFESAGNMDMENSADGDWTLADCELTLENEVTARYIRIDYSISGNFFWSSDIKVFGTSNDDTDSESMDDSVSEENASGDQNPESPAVSDSSTDSDGKSNAGGVIAIVVSAVAVIAVIGALFIKRRK